MSTPAQPTTTEPQTITIRLDLTYELKGDLGIFEAMEAAKELAAKAREKGSVEGHVMVGRQKYPIR
jgi:hypothetical protein